jgi:hypothetical protein
MIRSRGFDTSVNGKAVAREAKAIAKIAKKLKLPGIDDLASFAELAREFGVDAELEGAKEKWFEAEEGLRWVRSVYEYIDAHPESVKNGAQVLGGPGGVRIGAGEGGGGEGEVAFCDRLLMALAPVRFVQPRAIYRKERRMAESALTLASELLEGELGGLEELRIHEFAEDEEAHDDETIEKLYADFSAEFERVQAALTKRYGKPARVGKEDDDLIPLNGVFRFAIWTVGDKQLFAAAAHEDRGVPILLMLGTAEGDVD